MNLERSNNQPLVYMDLKSRLEGMDMRLECGSTDNVSFEDLKYKISDAKYMRRAQTAGTMLPSISSATVDHAFSPPGSPKTGTSNLSTLLLTKSESSAFPRDRVRPITTGRFSPDFGFSPIFSRCSNCGSPLKISEPSAFSQNGYSQGGYQRSYSRNGDGQSRRSSPRGGTRCGMSRSHSPQNRSVNATQPRKTNSAQSCRPKVACRCESQSELESKPMDTQNAIRDYHPEQSDVDHSITRFRPSSPEKFVPSMKPTGK